MIVVGAGGGVGEGGGVEGGGEGCVHHNKRSCTFASETARSGSKRFISSFRDMCSAS